MLNETKFLIHLGIHTSLLIPHLYKRLRPERVNLIWTVKK